MKTLTICCCEREVEQAIDIFVLCIILFGAGWTDLYCGKVKNRWLLTGVLAGILMKGQSFFPAALLFLVPGYCLYQMRMIGAGDGKLAALIAGYLGGGAALKAVGAGLAVGAFWSVCRLWRRHLFQLRLANLTAYIWRTVHLRELTEYEDFSAGDRTQMIPLAVCLTAGVYLYLFFSALLFVGKEFLA